MSPILDLQYRLRELGRIRMGKQEKRGNKSYPVKLDTWRLTSASRELLEAAAELLGGEVQVWADAPNEGEHFELITGTDSLDIIIPPNDAAFSQFMELWSGGGCQRRCDGERQYLRDVPCACPTDINERIEQAKKGKACSPHTRLNVMLPDLPDVGVWRLESHGYNAAVELAAFKQILDIAVDQGHMIRAKLKIEHRSKKRPGQKVNRYIVPVIQLDIRLAQTFEALGATITEASVSLPGPIEARNLPEDRPALPDVADGFAIEGSEEDAGSAAPAEPHGTEAPVPSPPRKEQPEGGGSGAAQPPSPSGHPAWLTKLQDHHYDNTIIEKADEVRRERGKRRAITTLEQVVPISQVPEAHRRLLELLGEPPSVLYDENHATIKALRMGHRRLSGRDKSITTCGQNNDLGRVALPEGEACSDCGWNPWEPFTTVPKEPPAMKPVSSEEPKEDVPEQASLDA